MAVCNECGEDYPDRRRQLGYRNCLECGDAHAHTVKFTVMPAYSKGAYQVVSREDVARTNPKRGD